jgi:hypothetical protein
MAGQTGFDLSPQIRVPALTINATGFTAVRARQCSCHAAGLQFQAVFSRLLAVALTGHLAYHLACVESTPDWHVAGEG